MQEKKERKKRGPKPKITAPLEGKGRGKGKLTLDLSGYPEILKQIKDQAHENFRTIEQQALYLIAQSLRSNNG